MARRVSEAARLSRAGCRSSVVARFSTERFVERHIEFYRHLLRTHRARSR